jgi:hypothetical protein
VVSGTGALPVLPALRELLPGGLQRGSVVAAEGWSLLCLALAAGASAAGSGCAIAGLPDLGVAAAADTGLDPGTSCDRGPGRWLAAAGGIPARRL